MPADLTTVAALGLYLRRDVSGDDLAAQAVAEASDLLRLLAAQDFDGVIDDIVVLDGSNTDALQLPQLPVLSVSSVMVDDVELDDATYYLNARQGVLYRKGLSFAGAGVRTIGHVWPKGRGRITVTYSHGYDTDSPTTAALPPVPRVLASLAAAVASRLYDQGIASQETVGGYQTIFGTPTPLSLSAAEQNIISRFRAGGH